MAWSGWTHERTLQAQGYRWIAGVDEAGRGPLAGPVVVAAVILPCGWDLPGLTDSKQITPRQRDRLYEDILAGAVAVSVAHASPGHIDRENIRRATLDCMRQAVNDLCPAPEYALIDGRDIPTLDCPAQAIVGGDRQCASIAAASIIAKVCRDRLMMAYHRRYPRYGFERHKGYPTRHHYAALAQWGPCPIHRQSFRLGRAVTHES